MRVILGLFMVISSAQAAPWWEDCRQLSAFASLAYSAAWEWDLPEDKFVISEDLNAPEDYEVRVEIRREAYHAPQALRMRVQMACGKKEAS